MEWFVRHNGQNITQTLIRWDIEIMTISYIFMDETIARWGLQQKRFPEAKLCRILSTLMLEQRK